MHPVRTKVGRIFVEIVKRRTRLDRKYDLEARWR